MAKYLVGSDGKIAARIEEPSGKKERKKYLMGSDGKIAARIEEKPFESKSSKAKEAVKTLGKAAARTWSVLASYKSKARKALKK